jgi:hypothetical protein
VGDDVGQRTLAQRERCLIRLGVGLPRLVGGERDPALFDLGDVLDQRRQTQAAEVGRPAASASVRPCVA